MGGWTDRLNEKQQKNTRNNQNYQIRQIDQENPIKPHNVRADL